jgi:hypothetical protein
MNTIIAFVVAGLLITVAGFVLCTTSLFYMMDKAPVVGEGWSIAAIIAMGFFCFCCGCYIVIAELEKLLR